MKQTVNNSQFQTAFHNMDRGSQFSYEALNLIYDYLESIEADTGEEIELDVIAICCDYSEMTPQEIADSYDFELDPDDDSEVSLDRAFAYIADNTFVVGHTDTTIVFAQF